MVVSNRPGKERRREEGRKKIRCRFSKWRSVWVMFETCAAHEKSLTVKLRVH